MMKNSHYDFEKENLIAVSHLPIIIVKYSPYVCGARETRESGGTDTSSWHSEFRRSDCHQSHNYCQSEIIDNASIPVVWVSRMQSLINCPSDSSTPNAVTPARQQLLWNVDPYTSAANGILQEIVTCMLSQNTFAQMDGMMKNVIRGLAGTTLARQMHSVRRSRGVNGVHYTEPYYRYGGE